MIRLWLAVIVLLTIQLATLAISRGYTPPSIAPMRDLSDMPQSFGDWASTDTTIDPRLQGAINTDEIINRIYSDKFGSSVVAHCAVWRDHEHQLPHVPTVCYPGTGWEIKSAEVLPLKDGSNSRVRFLQLEQADQRLHILYWYQRGDEWYWDTKGAKKVHRGLWGQESWPPLVKVLLQTSDPNPDRAKKSLREVAGHIAQWTN